MFGETSWNEDYTSKFSKELYQEPKWKSPKHFRESFLRIPETFSIHVQRQGAVLDELQQSNFFHE